MPPFLRYHWPIGRPHPRWSVGLGTLGLAVLLSGCGGTPEPVAPCPSARILDGAEQTSIYRAEGQRRSNDLRYVAALSELGSSCVYDDDGEGVEIGLRFRLIAERGPAFADTGENVSYFVATVGPGQEILSRDLLVSEVAFTEGQDLAGWVEDLTLRLPTVPADNGRSYVLYVGFALGDDEIRARDLPLFE